MQSSRAGYGGAARLFHWLTAFLIIVMFAMGWYMADLEFTDPEKFRLYQIHKSLGITIFVIAVVRLVWRLTHKAPPWPAHMSSLERFAAAGAHWALYGLILLQPVIGVLQSNAANFPIVFWDKVELPTLIGPNEWLGDALAWAHYILAVGLAGLILLHVAAALRHHVLLKDDVLRNMMPSAKVSAGAVVLSLALLMPPVLLIQPSRTTATTERTEEAAPVASESSTEEAPEDDQAVASGEAWAVEEGSTLGFIALQQGSEVKGTFERFDAEIVFDPDDLDGSRIDVDIDATSIDTGQSSRDETLNSPSFFDTATWPSAAFKSGAITSTGEGQYEAVGTLTIRDVTKDVVLPFTLTIEPDPDDPARERSNAKGDLPILRLDYGVGQGDWTSTTTVADEVVITIDIQASRPASSDQPSG